MALLPQADHAIKTTPPASTKAMRRRMLSTRT